MLTIEIDSDDGRIISTEVIFYLVTLLAFICPAFFLPNPKAKIIKYWNFFPLPQSQKFQLLITSEGLKEMDISI